MKENMPNDPSLFGWCCISYLCKNGMGLTSAFPRHQKSLCLIALSLHYVLLPVAYESLRIIVLFDGAGGNHRLKFPKMSPTRDNLY